MDEDRETFISQLERDFPRLDTALIRALASDFQPAADASPLLNMLEEISTATQNDDVDGVFDASGTGGINKHNDEGNIRSENDRSTPAMSGSTGMENALEQMSLATETTYTEEFNQAMTPMEELSDDKKITWLQDMFPDQKVGHVKFILQKANGSFKEALDVLLNNEFLEQENLLHKSVDGFAKNDFTPVKRKKKRGKDFKSLQEQDEEYIPERTASPWGGPSSSTPSRNPSPQVTEKIIPQYAPLKLDEDLQSAWTVASSGSSKTRIPTKPQTSAQHLDSRNLSYAKASEAYRRSKSDHLYAGAAAYYGNEARDHHMAWRRAAAAEADNLVSNNSSATHVDLHGVSIEDGRRIALAKVRQWWDGLGESKIRFRGKTGIGDGFRIVTGVGKHSAGGKGVLGPAVARALLTEGWKVEIGTGVVYVTGRSA